MGSVRISPNLEDKVRRVAAKKGISRSEVFRKALETYCSSELEPVAHSRYDDVIGVVDVPGDFSARTREVFGEILRDKFTEPTAK
jgi:metal-responsive CopG/Arc/MetJ family transcriptional regulator